jgi:hypothetical protein
MRSASASYLSDAQSYQGENASSAGESPSLPLSHISTDGCLSLLCSPCDCSTTSAASTMRARGARPTGETPNLDAHKPGLESRRDYTGATCLAQTRPAV